MTEIVYSHNDMKVTVKGHAESGKRGHDLVCAAVSALVYTLAENINAHSQHFEGMSASIRLDEGDAEIVCTECPSVLRAVIDIVFTTVCTGFEMLAQNYPENVKYTVV